MTLKAKYDGRAIVPDEPVDLPIGQPLSVTVEEIDRTSPSGVSGVRLNQWLQKQQIDPQAVAEMQRVIDEDCRKVDVDGW